MPLIRQARQEDISAVVALVQGAIPAMHAAGNFQWDTTYPLESDFIKDVENGWLFVAEDPETNVILGVAALTNDQPDDYASCGWDLSVEAVVPHRVAVRVESQGQGVAKLLLNHASTLAKEKGLTCVRVDTNSKNAKMQALLPSIGFTFAGEIELEGKPPGLKFYCYEKLVS